MKQSNPALAQKLALLSSNERRKLYKRAAQLRKSSMKKGGANRPDDDDQEGGNVKMKTKTGSLDDWVLKLLEQEAFEHQAMVDGHIERQGTVVWAGPKTVRVQCATTQRAGAYEVALNGHRAVVGDEVVFGGDETALLLSRVLPRRTKLSRPDPLNPHRELVVAANIDCIAVVVSLKSPPLHPRLIDRYLIAIQQGGAEPLVVLNKVDLASGEERERELEKLLPYVEQGVPIVACSADSGEGIDALREMLSGKLCAFVGHSGVGKSSLLNALEPGLGIETGEVWRGYGRGTHTTTASTLHQVGNGLRVIDTPGIRSFGLWNLDAAELSFYFPEFQGVACRFAGCSHSHEPSCGVKAAVASGRIARVRYDTYLRLMAELR